MLENSSRNRKLLAGVVGVNLALALAVLSLIHISEPTRPY